MGVRNRRNLAQVESNFHTFVSATGFLLGLQLRTGFRVDHIKICLYRRGKPDSSSFIETPFRGVRVEKKAISQAP